MIDASLVGNDVRGAVESADHKKLKDLGYYIGSGTRWEGDCLIKEYKAEGIYKKQCNGIPLDEGSPDLSGDKYGLFKETNI